MDFEISTLIKIILGILVAGTVILGLYFAFKDYINPFFRNVAGEVFIPFLR